MRRNLWHYGNSFILAAVLVMMASAGDPDATLEELPERRASFGGAEAAWEEGAMPSVDAIASMLTRKDGQRLFEKAIKRAKSPAPAVALVQGSEEVPVSSVDDFFGDKDEAGDDTLLLGLSSKNSLEKKEALADAHVQADKAALTLSNDAQDLQLLKSQMSHKVVSAKAQMAAGSSDGTETAKKAAALAKKVIVQTHKVQEDQTKEKSAKATVKKVSTMLGQISTDEDAAVDSIDADDSAEGTDENTGADEADEESHGGDLPDMVSQQLQSQADKFKAVADAEGSAAEKAKDEVAKLETKAASLSDELAKAKRDLMRTSLALKRHVARHTSATMMFNKITHREDHHKKKAAIEAKIRQQQQLLRVQSMSIKSSQEQLQKSLARKAQLEADNKLILQKQAAAQEEAASRSSNALAAAGVPADDQSDIGAAHKDTAITRAVDAVSQNLQAQDLEAALLPKVEKLKQQLHGEALRRAIDQLVSSTVANKVDTAFHNDPHVGQSIAQAVKSVRSSKEGTPTEAVEGTEPSDTMQQAEMSVSKVTDAGKMLDDAAAKLDQETGHGDLLMSLESVMDH